VQIDFKTPIFKISRAKWTGDLPQAVERLFCKHKTLSSSSSPTKKKDLEESWWSSSSDKDLPSK
jgi:hypothetical protein